MAVIDTTIYSQLLRPPKSVAEYDAEAMQVQQNRLAMQLNQGKLAEQQAGVARTNKLATILGGFQPGMATAVQGDTLTRAGFIDEGRKVIESGAKVNKDQREGEKAQREAEKEQFALARDQIAFVNQIVSSARDQASYTQGRQAMAARGMDVSAIPEQFDPAYVAAAGQQSLTELQRIDDVWKAKKFDLDVEQFGETKRSNRAAESDRDASRAVTVRGQDLVNARSRESNAAGAGSKPPAGYRWNKSGDLEPIPGGPASNKSSSSEGERKAATLLQRLEFSEQQLSEAVKGNPGAAKPGLLENGLRSVGMESMANSMTGSDRQRVDAAQLDILDAALTLGTGAAYTREQLEGYRKSYFPQIGDTPANVRDKQARLKNVIDAAKTQAGRSFQGSKVPAREQEPVSKAGIPQKGTSLDALLEKYKD